MHSLVDARARILKTTQEHYKATLASLALLAILAIVSIAASDGAEAWDTYNDNVEVGDNFETGYFSYVSGTGYSRGQYYYYSYYNYGYNYFHVYDTGSSERWGYMTYGTGSLDDRLYIGSATLGFLGYSSSSTNDVTVRVWLVTDDLRTCDPQSSMPVIDDGYYLGTVTLSGTSLSRYSISISGSALSQLRTAVADDDKYVYFAFTHYSGSATAYIYAWRYNYSPYYSYYSYVTLDYDNDAPNTPSINTMSAYQASTTAYFTWSASSDNPSGGNAGGVYYMAAVFSSSSTSVSPIMTYGWTGSTGVYFYGLTDGVTYYFRVKACDRYGGGYESSWSSYTYTTIDRSPPSVPVLEPEPLYTMGTTNVINWAPSTDDGIGVWYYQIQRSTRSDFNGASTYTAFSSSASFSGLTGGVTFYYRVRAVDSLSQPSAWSTPVASTQDDSPPTVPVMMEEPAFTPGDANTFNWHPSVDAGIGVEAYRVQVAWDNAFSPTRIVQDTIVEDTLLDISGLMHGRTYYCRVAARDLFGQESGWSEAVDSLQDAEGPTGPGLHAVAEFSPEGPLTLSWDGAMDNWLSGVSHYEVRWDNRSDWTGEWKSMPYIRGHSVLVYGLTPGETWYFKVLAYDNVGNEGEGEEANTTVDGEAPTAPMIDAEPAFTAGTENTIAWQAATDALSGVDHYVVQVFAKAGSGLVLTDTTDEVTTSMTVPALADGATYWYRVTAVDRAGNANASELAWSTQDASPPTPPMTWSLPMYTKGTEASVRWRASVDAGAGGVEYYLEWAQDDAFTTGVGESGWIAGTGHEVQGLDDGALCFFHVKARDALGHESDWGTLTYTYMDDSPPPAPALMEVDEFVPGPHVALEWAPVQDASGQLVTYQVQLFDTGDEGATPVDTSRWLAGTSYTWPGPDTDAPLYFRVVAKDPLGWVSDPGSAVTCTVDATGPSGAAIDELPEFSPGTSLAVTWTAATDGGVGGIVQRLVVYSDEGLTAPFISTEWSTGTEASVHGLRDGATYWFVVSCKDAFGNAGPASDAATTTMDASPPTVAVDAPGLFGPGEDVTGTCSDAGSGVASVEGSTDGDEWVEADVEDGEWSIDVGDFVAETIRGIWVRATDNVGNLLGAYAWAHVDNMAPTMEWYAPAPGSTVAGAVVISGRVADENLRSYTVEYRRLGADSWEDVQPEQFTDGVDGVLATWLTVGLPGGDYDIQVTAYDDPGQSTTMTVTLTLKGAKLAIGPADITFSNSHPLPGDKVTVTVTVRNTGDSPAEDVTVKLMANGAEVDSTTLPEVPAHGTATASFTVTAKDGQEYSAQAVSDLYDTGEMATGQPLNTIEEESFMENTAGVLGLLALILAIICLLLIILGKMGGREEPQEAKPAPREEEVILDPLLEGDLGGPEPLPGPMPGEDEGRPRTPGSR